MSKEPETAIVPVVRVARMRVEASEAYYALTRNLPEGQEPKWQEFSEILEDIIDEFYEETIGHLDMIE